MKYWMINGTPERGHLLHTALNRYGQTYEKKWKIPIGARDHIAWKRITKKEYDKEMQK